MKKAQHFQILEAIEHPDSWIGETIPILNGGFKTAMVSDFIYETEKEAIEVIKRCFKEGKRVAVIPAI